MQLTDSRLVFSPSDLNHFVECEHLTALDLLAAGKAATEMLMRGFTSIRDLGAPVFGLKRAIDAGLVVGLRIWPGNAELLALSGLRSPDPGKLGVIEEGALADLLLVNGDPVANLALVADPEKDFLVIVKDGRIYKNTVRPLGGAVILP